MSLKMHPSLHSPVGEWLRFEIVEPYGFTVSGVADHLKVSRQQMSALLNGRASLSAEMAVRFEKAFGISAATLMRMQVSYDLAQVELAGVLPDIERALLPA